MAQISVQQVYDGSSIYFQFLRVCGWGTLMNLGYSRWWDMYLYPFRADIAQERLVNHSIALLDVQPHQQVLDVACGKGKSSFFLATCYPTATIIGIDQVASHIAIATALYQHTHNLTYQQGEAEQLPFVEQSIDRIHCLEAAFHFNRAAFLQEAHRVLKPGGRSVIVDFMWKDAASRQMLNTDEGKICQELWQFEDLWTVDEYLTAAKQQGFQVNKLLDWSQPVTAMSHKRMQNMVKAADNTSFRKTLCKLHPPLNYFSPEDWQIARRYSDAHGPLLKHSRYMALVLEKVLEKQRPAL